MLLPHCGAQIVKVDLANPNGIVPVAYVNQIEDRAASHGDWESSGILDVSEYFGNGAWLVSGCTSSYNKGANCFQ